METESVKAILRIPCQKQSHLTDYDYRKFRFECMNAKLHPNKPGKNHFPQLYEF